MSTTKPAWMIRQGDVLVMAAERPPGAWQRVKRDGTKRVILAAGEVTGHHHAIHTPGVCMLRAEGVSDAVVTVRKMLAELVHEEHATIELPRGDYVVRIQREWGGEISRRVED